MLQERAFTVSLWLTNICVQICLVLIWLTGSGLQHAIDGASEMIPGALLSGRHFC